MNRGANNAFSTACHGGQCRDTAPPRREPAGNFPAPLGLPPAGPPPCPAPGPLRTAPGRLLAEGPRETADSRSRPQVGLAIFLEHVQYLWCGFFVLFWVLFVVFFEGGMEGRERASSRPRRPGRGCRGDWDGSGTRAALLQPQPPTPRWLPPRQVLRPTEENPGRGWKGSAPWSVALGVAEEPCSALAPVFPRACCPIPEPLELFGT